MGNGFEKGISIWRMVGSSSVILIMTKSISNRQKFSCRHWSFAKIPHAAGFPAVKKVFILNNLNETNPFLSFGCPLVAILVAKKKQWVTFWNELCLINQLYHHPPEIRPYETPIFGLMKPLFSPLVSLMNVSTSENFNQFLDLTVGFLPPAGG